MAQLSVKVQSFADGYRVCVGDVISPVADYGVPVELKVAGTLYVAYCDQDEKTGDVITHLSDWVLKAEVVKSEFEELDEDAPVDGDDAIENSEDLEDADEDAEQGEDADTDEDDQDDADDQE